MSSSDALKIETVSIIDFIALIEVFLGVTDHTYKAMGICIEDGKSKLLLWGKNHLKEST